MLRYRATLTNESKSPALMVRVVPVRSKSRDRILPAVMSDNYLILMPGESREITIELKQADTRGETPAFTVQSYYRGGAN